MPSTMPSSEPNTRSATSSVVCSDAFMCPPWPRSTAIDRGDLGTALVRDERTPAIGTDADRGGSSHAVAVGFETHQSPGRRRAVN